MSLEQLNEQEEMLLKELDEIRFKKLVIIRKQIVEKQTMKLQIEVNEIINFIDTNKDKINDLQFNNQTLDDLNNIKQTFKELISKF